MSLEHLNLIAQIASTLGVVLSLIFVGYQIRQNTVAIQRGEHNSTMAQWTVLRQAIATNREVAELMTTGLNGERPLDAADQLRLEQFLQEYAWASFHIWDRTQRGVFPKGTFEFSVGSVLVSLLTSPRGAPWWQKAKTIGFVPQFVADVDAVLGS